MKGEQLFLSEKEEFILLKKGLKRESQWSIDTAGLSQCPAEIQQLLENAHNNLRELALLDGLQPCG
jgi:hypothetical protein